MHFAAFAYVGEVVTDPAKYYRNNVVSTLTLLDAMRTARRRAVRLLQHLRHLRHPRDRADHRGRAAGADQPLRPTKLVVERCWPTTPAPTAWASRPCATSTRAAPPPTATIGEDHDPETHLIPLVLQAALGRRPHVDGLRHRLPDAGRHLRPRLHPRRRPGRRPPAAPWSGSTGAAAALQPRHRHRRQRARRDRRARRVTGRPIPSSSAPPRRRSPAWWPRPPPAASSAGPPAPPGSTRSWSPPGNGTPPTPTAMATASPQASRADSFAGAAMPLRRPASTARTMTSAAIGMPRLSESSTRS